MVPREESSPIQGEWRSEDQRSRSHDSSSPHRTEWPERERDDGEARGESCQWEIESK